MVLPLAVSEISFNAEIIFPNSSIPQLQNTVGTFKTSHIQNFLALLKQWVHLELCKWGKQENQLQSNGSEGFGADFIPCLCQLLSVLISKTPGCQIHRLHKAKAGSHIFGDICLVCWVFRQGRGWDYQAYHLSHFVQCLIAELGTGTGKGVKTQYFSIWLKVFSDSEIHTI